MTDLVDLDCRVLHETDLALLILVGDKKAWVPKSQCELTDEGITMPQWLAQDKELI